MLEGQWFPKQAVQFSGGPNAVTASLTTLTFVDSANADATTITVPATAAAGDVAVYFDVQSTVGSGNAAPAGWTQIGTDLTFSGTGNRRARILAKILTGGDAGASVGGFTEGGNNRKMMQVYRGDKAVSAITGGGFVSVASDSKPAQQTILASGRTPPLLYVAGYASSSAISPRTSSFTADAETASGTSAYLKSAAVNPPSAPADVTFDMDDEGNANALLGCWIECS